MASHLSASRNFLLAALSEEDADLLRVFMEPVNLKLRYYMERPHKPIEHVYFMESGLGSVVATGGSDRQIEVGIFGREGMSGSAVVMGNDRSPHETYVQVPGDGQRISSDALRHAMDRSLTLRLYLLHFVQVMMVQTAQTALCNGKAKLEERLARWLLMCHDRVEGDELTLTHEFLALMLGVRRAGVTVAIHQLERQGLILTTRGVINIADRDGLLEAADSSYGLPEAEYKRLMG